MLVPRLRVGVWFSWISVTVGTQLRGIVDAKGSQPPDGLTPSILPPIPREAPPRYPAWPLSKTAGAQQAKCLEGAGFKWSPMEEYPYVVFATTIQPHQRPEGIGALCNWSIGVRWEGFHTFGNAAQAPAIIFMNVSMIGPFVRTVLHCLTARFVLIIGDEDMTAPRQMDPRWLASWNIGEWEKLVASPLVAHIWVAHLDVPPSRKVSPFPVGLNSAEFQTQDSNELYSKQNVPPSNILDRPLKALVCGRVREDGHNHWKTRQTVHSLCKTDWKDACDDRDIAGDVFVQEITKYPFLVCEHGGGLDPSPKSWTALIVGVIPIIKHFPGDDIYRDMPVLFVDSWDEFDLKAETLEKARHELAHYFNDPADWAKVIEKLQTRYWYDMVIKSLETGLGFGWSELDKNESRER